MRTRPPAAGRGVNWRKLALLLLLCALPPAVAPPAQAVERRRDQFLTEPAFLIVPFPFNVPGIGRGIAITGLAANVADTTTDLFGIIITGDVSGTIATLDEFHIVDENLILSLSLRKIDKAVVNSYESRGIDSNPDNFNLLELSRADGQGIALCFCFFQRMVELTFGQEMDSSRIDRLRDSDGNIIGEFDRPITGEETTRSVGLLLDFTDDRKDPRRGVRLGVERRATPPNDADDPDFFVTDLSLSFYLPVGSISTIVFNYFQSDATVKREGETDPVALRADFSLNCASGDQQCLVAEQRLIDRAIAANRFGTATSLGGAFGRLRAYPVGRFQGAHTVFYGAEFRWNLTDESTPFDYFIWKDVRSNLQVAFFAETGSVAETRDELDKFKSSYGVGFRLISASGFVYRADIAAGDEGTEFVLIFGYPF